jgi:hypothetical protein
MCSRYHWSPPVGTSTISLSSNSESDFLISSLVTTLRAAEKFPQSHLSSPHLTSLIEAAKVFYVEGYFMTHGADSIVEVGTKAANASKVRYHSVCHEGPY